MAWRFRIVLFEAITRMYSRRPARRCRMHQMPAWPPVTALCTHDAALERPRIPPPSIGMFCPVMKLACWLAEEGAGGAEFVERSPMRCVGSSTGVRQRFRPPSCRRALAQLASMVCMRSVSNGPGSRPLMVTLRLATLGVARDRRRSRSDRSARRWTDRACRWGPSPRRT